MVLIDSHTHLYDQVFDDDRFAVLQRAEQNNIAHLFLPAIDSHYHERMIQLARSQPDTCHPMMGLHPTSIRENFREELNIIEKYLSDSDHPFSAIGEIGLDFYWDRTFENEQFIAFNHQLDLALHYNLPLVIHTRNSMEEAMRMIEKRNNPGLRGVFHCFSGNLEQAMRAIRNGFLIGIGGVVTYKNSGLIKIVEGISLENILLETDAPYLPPVPYRGQRNEPSYIPYIVAKIAEIRQQPPEEIAAITTKNALSLFGI